MSSAGWISPEPVRAFSIRSYTAHLYAHHTLRIRWALSSEDSLTYHRTPSSVTDPRLTTLKLVVFYYYNMKNLKAEITRRLTEIEGCQFVSFVYLSKGAGELARHTLNIGFNYNKLVEKSVSELETIIALEANTWTDLQKTAANNVLASLKKTLAAHAVGEQNADYTKRGQYIPLGKGVNVNANDNTIQVFGLANQKRVFVPGVYPHVNHRPLTIAQDEIRERLSVSKIREFALDEENIAAVRVDGDTLYMEDPREQKFVPA